MIRINRVQRYFLNAVIMSVGSIIIHSVSVAFNVYISDKVGAEAMGLFTLTSGIYSFAITLATSGINLAVVRLVSAALPYEEKTSKSISSNGACVKKIMINALFYCLFFSSLASLILFFGAKPIGMYLLNDLRVIPSLKIMSLSLMPISVSSMLNGYFCAVRRVYKNVVVQFFEQGVKISLVVMLVLFVSPKGIGYACLAISLGGMISELASLILNIILFLFDRRLHTIPTDKDKIPKKSAYAVFACAFPVAVSAYVRSALSTIEHLAIPWGLKKNGLDSSSALSSYGVLHGMVFPLIFFPSAVLGAFSSLLVPEISSSYEAKDYERIKSIASYVFGFSLLFSLGVSGIFICFSNEIGAYFFKSDDAGEFIRLIAPLVPLMYLDFSVDSMLKGLGEQIYSMRINIFDSLISVILILILVPSLGINGYIIVIFVTELFNTSMSIMRLLKKTGLKPMLIKWIFKPTLSIIGATLLSRLIFDNDVSYTLLSKIGLGKVTTIIEICFCVLFYVIFTRVSGSISKEEVSLAKGLVKS